MRFRSHAIGEKVKILFNVERLIIVKQILFECLNILKNV